MARLKFIGKKSFEYLAVLFIGAVVFAYSYPAISYLRIWCCGANHDPDIKDFDPDKYLREFDQKHPKNH